MGTLHNQRPRQDTMASYLFSIEQTLTRMGFDRQKATPDQWRAAAEVTLAALAIQNADALDEQLSGFGRCLDNLTDALNGIADAIAGRIDDHAEAP